MRSPNSEKEPTIVRVVDKRPRVSKPEPKMVRVHDARPEKSIAHRRADQNGAF